MDCITRAARFFRQRCLIATPEFVPYSYQAVIIAAALENSSPELNAIQSTGLWRWLWTTTYTAFFLGARSQNINAALKTVRRIILYGDEKDKQTEELIEALPKRFDFRAARSKAFAIRLAELRPKTADGHDIDLCATLSANGATALVQLADSSLPLATSGPENRFLYPPVRWPVDKIFAGRGQASEEFFQSHGIPESAADLWRQYKLDQLLQRRREHLREIECEFVMGLGLRYSAI